MWMYVVCLGFAMLIDPMRIGIAAVLMSRRRAVVCLAAYWVGGMIAGIAVGVAVLVLLHDVALVALKAAASAFNEMRSAGMFLTGAHLRIALGVLLLSVVAVMVARDRGQLATRVPIPVGGGAGDVAPDPPKANLLTAWAARTLGMLESGFVWPAFALGVMSTFPPVEGPIALTVIMGSRTAAGTQFSAFVLFTLLVLAFVEIPLVSYLAAPRKTEAMMLQVNTWITAHRRQVFEVGFAVAGLVSLVQGVSGF